MKQSCQQCGQRFSYSQILKSICFMWAPVTCERCGRRHVISIYARTKISMFIVLIPFLFMGIFRSMIPLGVYETLALAIAAFLPGVLLSPYFTEYELEQW